MITSMTGFASVARESEGVSVSATVRTVNHRYLDLQVRMPSSLGGLEAGIRTCVQKRLARGRVEVSLSVQDRRRGPVEVSINEALVAGVAAAIGRVREAGLVVGALSPSDVLRLPDALSIREVAAPDEGADAALACLVQACVEAAVQDLDAMRRREGQFLESDLETRRVGLAETIGQLAAAAAEGQAALETRLARRIQELNLDTASDAAALAQEIVRFVARSDISEEVVRFRAHLAHWADLVASPDPCGRKLDFLLQEMNREINTIGSKAEGVRIPELIVHAKAELEKMREQVQNVE